MRMYMYACRGHAYVHAGTVHGGVYGAIQPARGNLDRLQGFMSCCVLVIVCTNITMDCWKTQFVAGCGNQASASRVFISSDDKACTSGRVECTAESATIDCNVELDLPDLDVDDEIVVVS